MVSGEEIETSWARLNHLQYSIREMDAGARVDMITSHMLAANEEKMKNIGSSYYPLPYFSIYQSLKRCASL
jgi:hypothetical protein